MDVKAALKEARAQIGADKPDLAAQICNNILKQDPRNYHAFVFLGLASFKNGQPVAAEEAYEKAIAIDSKQLLAFQGLLSLYEKDDSRKIDNKRQKQAATLEKLILLHHSDETARVECEEKLLELYPLIAQNNKAAHILRSRVTKSTPKATSVPLLLRCCNLMQEHEASLFPTKIFSKQVFVENSTFYLENDQIYESTLELFELGEPQRVEVYVAYIKSLDSRRKFGVIADGLLAHHAQLVLAESPQNVTACNLLVRLAEEDSNYVDEATLKSCMTVLRSRSPDSLYSIVSQGQIESSRHQWSEAVNLFRRALEMDSECLTAIHGLVQVGLHNIDMPLTLECALQGVALVETFEARFARIAWQRLMLDFLLYSAKASLALGRDELNTAEAVLKKLRSRFPKHVRGAYGLAMVAMLRGEIENAMDLCTEALTLENADIESIALRGWLFYKTDRSRACSDLAFACSTNPNQHFVRLWQAHVQWDDGNFADSASHAMAAVKLNPRSASALGVLGRFYDKCANNMSYARRCYQQAIDLDAAEPISGPNLYALLLRSGLRQDAYSLCADIVARAPLALIAWAVVRLGHEHLRNQLYSEAVLCGQSVTRVELDNALGWELLGDAYSGRGAFVAALACFERVAQLEPDNIYCAVRIGSIQHVLGNFDEAVASYSVILDKYPRYLPALQGIGEVRLSMARDQLSDGLTGAAAKNIVLGIEKLVEALQISSQFQCIWKLLGDICMLSQGIPATTLAQLKLPSDVYEFLKTDNPYQENDAILRLAGFAYDINMKCAPITARAAPLGDIARCMLARSRRLLELNTPSSIRFHQAILQDAFVVIKQAVRLQSKSAYLWNVFGAIAFALKGYALAQHGFIVSLRLDGSSPYPWTNLGAIYVATGRVELAHRAFSNAQALDPSQAAPWVGQATVAEAIGHSEALDLFRHATQLAPLPWACIGFARQVAMSIFAANPTENLEIYLKTSKKVSNIPLGYEDYYVSQAIVALSKYLHSRAGCSDANAYNIYGLLLERAKLYPSSEEAFAMSLSLLKQTVKEQSLIDSVRVNYARVLLHRGACSQSLEMIQPLPANPSFFELSLLGSLYFALGRNPESFQTYQAAQGLAQQLGGGRLLAENQVALAIVAVAHNDIAAAKALLFQAVVDPTQCPHALFVMAALGLVQRDGVLAAAAIAEFPKLLGSSVHAHAAFVDFHFVRACMQVLSDNTSLAKGAISKAVHAFPDQQEHWHRLSSFLLSSEIIPRGRKSNKLQSSNAALAALVCCEGGRNVSRDDEHRVGYELSAMARLKSGDSDIALQHAQRAVNVAPTVPEAWALLGASQLANALKTLNASGIKLAINSLGVAINMNASRLTTLTVTAVDQLRGAPWISLKEWLEVCRIYSSLVFALLESSEDGRNSLLQSVVQQARSLVSNCSTVSWVYQARLLLARVLFEVGQDGPAFAELCEAARLIPTQSDAWHLLGSIYLVRGEGRKSEAALRRGLDSRPSWLDITIIASQLKDLGQLSGNDALSTEMAALLKSSKK